MNDNGPSPELTGDLSMSGIARLARIEPAAVSNWRRRHHDFPTPNEFDRFTTADVVAWLDTRRIPRPSLTEGEAPGTTYGARARATLGIADTGMGRSAGRAVSDAEGVTGQVWLALERHRGEQDLRAYGDLVVALLYVRVRDPHRWAALTRSSRSPDHDGLTAQLAAAIADHSHPRALRQLVSEEAIQTGDPARLAGIIASLDTLPRTAASCMRELLTRFDMARHRSDVKYSRDRPIPDSIVRTEVALLALRAGESIHDLCCGSGAVLEATALRARHTHALFGDLVAPSSLAVSGDALDARSWARTHLALAAHGITADLGPQPTSALSGGHRLGERFDMVVANPPFHMRDWVDDLHREPYWRYGTPPRHNANFAWLQRAIAALTAHGRAAVLMPGNAATSQNPTEHRIRAAMVEDGVIEAVISLPPQLFTWTAGPVTLWMLRPPTTPHAIGMVDASRLGTMVSRTQRVLTDDDVQRIVDLYLSAISADGHLMRRTITLPPTTWQPPAPPS